MVHSAGIYDTGDIEYTTGFQKLHMHIWSDKVSPHQWFALQFILRPLSGAVWSRCVEPLCGAVANTRSLWTVDFLSALKRAAAGIEKLKRYRDENTSAFSFCEPYLFKLFNLIKNGE